MALVPQHRQEEWYQEIIQSIQAISGGGSGVIVAYTEDSLGNISCSHTFTEIQTLITNGVLVRASFKSQYLTLSHNDSDTIEFSLSSVWIDSNNTLQVQYTLIKHDSDGTITSDSSAD